MNYKKLSKITDVSHKVLDAKLPLTKESIRENPELANFIMFFIDGVIPQSTMESIKAQIASEYGLNPRRYDNISDITNYIAQYVVPKGSWKEYSFHVWSIIEKNLSPQVMKNVLERLSKVLEEGFEDSRKVRDAKHSWNDIPPLEGLRAFDKWALQSTIDGIIEEITPELDLDPHKHYDSLLDIYDDYYDWDIRNDLHNTDVKLWSAVSKHLIPEFKKAFLEYYFQDDIEDSRKRPTQKRKPIKRQK